MVKEECKQISILSLGATATLHRTLVDQFSILVSQVKVLMSAAMFYLSTHNILLILPPH